MNRTLKIALLSLVFNMAFAAYHIVYGTLTHSWWLFTAGIYYSILSIVRFAVLQSRRNKHTVTRFAGVMLMLLSLSLVGTVILAVVRDRGVVMHEIVMIAMAVYSFTKITLATLNLIGSRKSTSAKLITLRNISFADACVSIFALQRSMLVSFGDMSTTDVSVFNAVIGSAVCIVVFLLGLNLVRSKKILFKKLK